MVGLVNVAQTRCRPPGVGQSGEALSRVDDPAGPGRNAHLGTAVGGVEVSYVLFSLHSYGSVYYSFLPEQKFSIT
ncbi:MAG: hypothetical protein J4F35_14940 [Candidatus Latescibacteria bacterium]|nr:hypothetical protein [Candidatus Latescibacterota bacterium]